MRTPVLRKVFVACAVLSSGGRAHRKWRSPAPRGKRKVQTKVSGLLSNLPRHECVGKAWIEVLHSRGWYACGRKALAALGGHPRRCSPASMR